MATALDSISTTERKHLSSWLSDFRDTADGDYIAARSLYRLALHTQAAWSAAQALEKYFKAVLMFSCVSVRDYRDHNLLRLFDKAKELPHLNFRLPDDCVSFLDRINLEGGNRYGDMPVVFDALDVHQLDRLVWHVRRFCRDCFLMPGDEERYPGERDQRLSSIPADLPSATLRSFVIPDGYLESVVTTDPKSKQQHQQRAALIWKNRYYTTRRRKKMRFVGSFGFKKPLHIMRPEILVSIIERLVYLPNKVLNDLRALKSERERELSAKGTPK